MLLQVQLYQDWLKHQFKNAAHQEILLLDKPQRYLSASPFFSSVQYCESIVSINFLNFGSTSSTRIFSINSFKSFNSPSFNHLDLNNNSSKTKFHFPSKKSFHSKRHHQVTSSIFVINSQISR
jgi:hypothetical protein